MTDIKPIFILEDLEFKLRNVQIDNYREENDVKVMFVSLVQHVKVLNETNTTKYS